VSRRKSSFGDNPAGHFLAFAIFPLKGGHSSQDVCYTLGLIALVVVTGVPALAIATQLLFNPLGQIFQVHQSFPSYRMSDTLSILVNPRVKLPRQSRGLTILVPISNEPIIHTHRQGRAANPADRVNKRGLSSYFIRHGASLIKAAEKF
jgi:hypothetical protein